MNKEHRIKAVTGTYIGTEKNDVISYCNIRYAIADRWMPPKREY